MLLEDVPIYQIPLAIHFPYVQFLLIKPLGILPLPVLVMLTLALEYGTFATQTVVSGHLG